MILKPRVFIPSKGRPQTSYSIKTFPSATVVVHNQEEKERYAAHNPNTGIVVSNVPADKFGLTRQREWICNNLAVKGEWIVFADDNIRTLLALPDEHYYKASLPIEPKVESCSYWRPFYRTPCTEQRFLETIAMDTIKHCEQVGAHLAGFPSTDNILFRKQKFKDVGYVIGKLMVWHNTREVPFDHTISMEDFYHTAEHLMRYGKVVVNNYCWPRAYHYEAGGLGKYPERVAIRKQDVKTLMARYPGLLRIKDREGFVPGTDLQLAVTSATIGKWRAGRTAKRLF